MMKYVGVEVTERLFDMAKQLGVTLAVIADVVGVTDRMVSNWKVNQAIPLDAADTLHKFLARRLAYRCYDFATLTDDMNDESMQRDHLVVNRSTDLNDYL